MVGALGYHPISLPDQYTFTPPMAANVVCSWHTAEVLLKSCSQLNRAAWLKTMQPFLGATHIQRLVKTRVIKWEYKDEETEAWKYE